jgi:sulfur-carrier protein
MKVSVHFFARARELAGTATASVDVPDGATLADLRQQLAIRYPALAGLLARAALAVNNEFADDSLVLWEAAEVALLPPVSGG